MIRAGRAPTPVTPLLPRPRVESLGWDDQPDRPDEPHERKSAMSVLLNPYLNFPDGKAREALEFYASVLGGEPNIMTFGDMGTEGPAANQVMHGQLETPDGFTIMGADAPPEFVQVTFGDNVSVSISGDDAEKMTGWFNALSEGAQAVTAPLEKQMWGDVFGSFKDRFGTSWLFNISGDAS